jgi:hypothetical protein
VHYHEAWLLTELLENLSLPAPRLAGWNGPSTDRGMQVADPTALAALVTPDLGCVRNLSRILLPTF